MTAVRAGLITFSLVACAWFVLGNAQARGTNRATAELAASRPLTAARAADVRSALSTAGTLNPDLTVDILKGKLAFVQGDRREALRVLDSVTAREPDNLEAWLLLAQTVLHHDAGALDHAVAQIGRLDPRIR